MKLEKDFSEIEDDPEENRDSKGREYPARPASCAYTCMRDLYLEFSRIFLNPGRVDSVCGHTVAVFDHHFFHMAAIAVEDRGRLFMAEEKAAILAMTEGFGHFKVLHGGSRANNLPSAYATIADPDEVWEENPRCTNARWAYIKQFASTPYPYTVALVTDRTKEKLIVPVSSFPCKRGDIKKWRGGRQIY